MTSVTESTISLAEFDNGLRKDPLGTMESLCAMGRVVAFPLEQGRRLLVSNDPRVSMAALAHGERTHRELLRQLVGPGLFVVATGEQWQTRRALVRPLFSTHAQTDYHATVAAAAEDFVERVLIPLEGQDFKLAPLMQQLSVEIILALTLPDLSAAERGELTSALLEAVVFLDHRLFDPELVQPGDEEKFFAHKARLVAAIESAAARGGDGIVAHLKGRVDEHAEWSEEERADALREEVMSIFVAGVETMGALFTWIVWNLAAHSEQQDLCRAEALSDEFGMIRSMDSRPRDGAFPWLEANVRETLRLTPPAWALFRRMPQDQHVDGVHLGVGDQVLAATWSTHRSPDLWDEPEKYVPQRFKDSTPPQGQFFPFGAGPHQCLGKALSVMEAQVAIGMILRAGAIAVTGDVSRHALKPAIALHLDPSPMARFESRTALSQPSSGAAES